MADTARAVQAAVYAALMGDDGLIAAFSAAPRVYDRPPFGEDATGRLRPPAFPYITIGDDDLVDDGTTCGPAWEVFVRAHVWSRAPGRMEAKRLAGLVEAALNAPLAVAGHVCVEHQFRSTRVIADPDGHTTHAVVELRYLVDPA